MAPLLRSCGPTPRRPGRSDGIVVAIALGSLLTTGIGCPTGDPYGARPPKKSEPTVSADNRSASVRPAPSVEPPPTADPVAPPTPSDATVPEALRGTVSPSARLFWSALSKVDGGDANAMDEAMHPGAPWLTPGAPQEAPIAGRDLWRAMSPWSGAQIHPRIRRVVDFSPKRVLVQLVVESQVSPEHPFEMALILDARDDRLSAIRQYGDPLGPVRTRSEDADRTLDLGSPTTIDVQGGPPTVANVAVTKAWMAAIASDDDAAATKLLSPTVIFYDIQGRKTVRGAKAVVEAYRSKLGDNGAVKVNHEHATARVVMVEGAIYGRETGPDDTPWEHGVVDLYWLDNGKIAEVWQYLNRRGRPHITGARTAVAGR